MSSISSIHSSLIKEDNLRASITRDVSRVVWWVLNRIMGRILSVFVNVKFADLAKMLLYVMMSYNSTVDKITGYISHDAMKEYQRPSGYSL